MKTRLYPQRPSARMKTSNDLVQLSSGTNSSKMLRPFNMTMTDRLWMFEDGSDIAFNDGSVINTGE